MTSNKTSVRSSSSVTFADVAHQTLIFDRDDSSSALILELLDTRWCQRLRQIRQTGNTNLVYMFAEHSRFGHSLGVAYLAITLMNHLERWSPEDVKSYRNAVAAAAILHDIGHTAPGSHLAEQVWHKRIGFRHEAITKRVIKEDNDISRILSRYSQDLSNQTISILDNSKDIPSWTRGIISGGGWNADRGNWTIVDSAMCGVSYGRYNVLALIDAFRLSSKGELVLLESRLDALTHFLVARDSMYRQVYQHRTLQAVDALSLNIILRLNDLMAEKLGSNATSESEVSKIADSLSIFLDKTMAQVLANQNSFLTLSLETIYNMTESWWMYHISRWCNCQDAILSDLSMRLINRRLFKTIRVGVDEAGSVSHLKTRALEIATSLGFDPRYYVVLIDNADRHRQAKESPPLVLLDSGECVPVTEVEPMIPSLFEPREARKVWLAVPKEVKEKMGKIR